jgi:hypothetical protein
MLDVAQGLRIPTMPQAESADDPYVALVMAIVGRAVQDAQGRVVHPGNRAPVQIEVEARAWLDDGRELAALLELAGFDPAPVLRRVRQLFPPQERGD